VTDQALLVLRAVTEVCDELADDAAPTSVVAQRARAHSPRSGRWVRAHLRALHRRGYLRRSVADGGVLRWAATEKGRLALKENS